MDGKAHTGQTDSLQADERHSRGLQAVLHHLNRAPEATQQERRGAIGRRQTRRGVVLCVVVWVVMVCVMVWVVMVGGGGMCGDGVRGGGVRGGGDMH